MNIELTLSQAIGYTIGGFLTLFIFSFLYDDNPLYKFAEHLFVGTSAAYWFVVQYHNIIKPNVIKPFQEGNFWPIIPVILGIFMLFRLIPSLSVLSRMGIAFSVGVMAGYQIIRHLETNILRQIGATMQGFENISFSAGNVGSAINTILILLVVLSALVYFFFSVEHEGAVGGIAKFGMWMLMITFGATFGYTVMARISLLIGRVLYLKEQWWMSIKYLLGV